MTCCIGDMFFRKRRYSSDVYTPTVKPKIPLGDSNVEETKVSLHENLARLRIQAEVTASAPVRQSSDCRTAQSNARPLTAVDYCNSERNTLIFTASNSENGSTAGPCLRTAPVTRFGTALDDPPPKYSPPRSVPSNAADRLQSRTNRGDENTARDSNKQQELLLQNMWIENNRLSTGGAPNGGGVLQVETAARTPNNGLRNITILDKTTNTTYRRGRLLGKGGFARCYEMTDTETNVLYAGKVISKLRVSKPRQYEKIMREIELHRSLRHEHVVEFHSFFEDEQNIYFILEYCSKKSLVDVLRTRQTLSEPEVRYYMNQLVEGCRYVHGNHIIHRDLKLGNMLLNDNMKVKIADFGLATRIDYRGEKKMTVCGTPNYIAPEIIQRRGHSYEADIWSIGCIMYTLICGRPPFETSSLKETYDRIANNHYVIPSHVSPQAADLIKRMLSHNPNDRPKLDSILRHDFFRSGHLPKSLSATCSYTVPKFPAFEAPSRPQSFAAPVSATHEAKIIDQQLQRTSSQRMAPHTRRAVPTSTKKELKVDLEPVKERLDDVDGELGLFSRIGSAGRLCSAVRLYTMLSSCLDTMPPDSNPTPVQHVKPLWVTKWVDYSNKYGFGYQLSDGSVGILFNDTTRMALLTDGRTLQYNDLSNRISTLNKEMVPNDLQKKVTLLLYFSQYMDEHLIYGANVDNATKKKQPSTGGATDDENKLGSISTTAVFMKKWFRTERAVVMHLNNGTLQVNFFEDHTKVIISPDAQDYLVTYIDAFRYTVAYRLLQLRHFGCSIELVDRLDYARHSLKTVINVGSEAV